MAERVELRLAEPNDIEPLLVLLPNLSRDKNTLRASVPHLVEALKIFDEMQQRGIQIIIAAKENSLVGSCSIVIVPNLTNGGQPWAIIENVVVDPTQRGNGIGTSLMNFAVDIAKEAGCYKVQLISGPKEEQIKFYKQLGFDNEHATGFKKYL